ncbi:MAG: PilZ domain-containing protein [Acidiferrobacterales bacterium]
MARKPIPAERDGSQRRTVDVKAMVADDHLGLTKCHLTDIGIDGASIEIGDLKLTKGARIDLVLKIRARDTRTHCRVPAKVIRVSKNTAVLAFEDLEERVYQELFDIVYPH